MSRHKNGCTVGGREYDATRPEHHLPVLKIFIHVADLSNPTKAWPVYERWTTQIMEEFYVQADLEKERGLVGTVPLRGSCKMGKFQLGFLTFIRPLFATADRIGNVDLTIQLDGLDATIAVRPLAFFPRDTHPHPVCRSGRRARTRTRARRRSRSRETAVGGRSPAPPPLPFAPPYAPPFL